MKNLRVIATANTMVDLSMDLRQYGREHLRKGGFEVSFPKNPEKKLYHLAGTAEERIVDIHEALLDTNVYGLLSIFGGYNTNQILEKLDFDLLKSSGKPLIGYSDFTALLLAASSKGARCAFHGPSFASFCDPYLFEYSIANFQDVIEGRPVTYQSPRFFADDLWYLKKEHGPRDIKSMDDWYILCEGESRGPILGGNLETLTKLAGTKYMPDFEGAILFIEDMTGNNPGTFHRDMTHLRYLGILSVISGLIIGKFPAGSKLDDRNLLNYILSDVYGGKLTRPTIADVHCSHVDPMITIPMGRLAYLRAFDNPSIMVNA